MRRKATFLLEDSRMFKKLFRQNENFIDGELSPELPLPKHVAIIMDGNGRWAKKKTFATDCGT